MAALRAGADWEVEFVPFSLSQGHLEEGDPPVWDDPDKARDLLAMQAGIVVRDRNPERFVEVHGALFRARHDQGRDLRREEVVRQVLSEAGADADAVMAEVGTGWPLETFRKEHEASESNYDVWGVPTFIAGARAAFVRLMSRPDPENAAGSAALIERVVTAVGEWADINELKHTTLER
jgi:protein-disulfide isomerase-like protein with CxxC motif